MYNKIIYNEIIQNSTISYLSVLPFSIKACLLNEYFFQMIISRNMRVSEVPENMI